MFKKLIFLFLILCILGFTNNFRQNDTKFKLCEKLDSSIEIPKSTTILLIAYEEGKKINFPETIQAIVLQESSAGKNLIGDISNGFGKRSYGVMQLKLGTAKYVLRHFFKDHFYFKTDEELLIKLVTDPVFNIKIGTQYFKMIYDNINVSNKNLRWVKSVARYNAGHNTNLNNFQYVNKIKKRISTEVKPFNKTMGLF